MTKIQALSTWRLATRNVANATQNMRKKHFEIWYYSITVFTVPYQFIWS